MSSFQTVRPWIAGIGLVVWLVIYIMPTLFQSAPEDSFDDDQNLEWVAGLVLLSWVLPLILTGMAPAERQGIFVRYGAFLGIVAALLAVVAALLLGWGVSSTGTPPDDASDWTFAQRTLGVAWLLSVFTVTYLVLLSAIHLARFQMPRLRSQGDRQVLVIRPRRPGKLALVLRIAGMALVATAVIALLWTPIFLMTGTVPGSFLEISPAVGLGASLLGAVLLFVSRFADGPKRPRPPAPRRPSRIVVEAPPPESLPRKK